MRIDPFMFQHEFHRRDYLAIVRARQSGPEIARFPSSMSLCPFITCGAQVENENMKYLEV